MNGGKHTANSGRPPIAGNVAQTDARCHVRLTTRDETLNWSKNGHLRFDPSGCSES